MLRVASLLLLLSVASCALPTRDDDVASASSPILNGEIDTQVPGVVAVIDRALHTTCSGVLVNERAIVTARHCVAPIDSAVVDCHATVFGDESAPADVVVRTTVEHVAQRIVVPEQRGYCGGDLAVILLEEPVPASEATPIALRLDRAATPGERFAAIGFGRDEVDSVGTRRRRDGLAVQCVGEGCNSAQLDGREWWGEGAVCEGDSGGPALDEEGRVIGIASRKRAGCTATIYGGVAESAPFLRKTLGLPEPAAGDARDEPAARGCSVGRNTPASGVCVAIAAALMLRARRRGRDARARARCSR